MVSYRLSLFWVISESNGIGLTKERVESAKKEGRLGIFGIQERILDFSGEFKVLNNKKYSTILMCKFKTETIEEKSNENTIDWWS